jgi:hypothetical protein
VFAAACLATSLPASATTGLAWQWEEDETRQYVVRADVHLPGGRPMFAEKNIDAYFTRAKVVLLLSCAPKATMGKKGWLMKCDIDDAALSAEPLPNSIGLVEQVIPEWTNVWINDAWVEFNLTRDGRVRSIDLEGVDKSIRRKQFIWESMRQLMVRALAPFNLQLPKKGDDKGYGYWVQQDHIGLTLPSNQGSLGGVNVIQKLTELPDLPENVSFIVSHGEGTIATGEEVGDVSIRNSYGMVLDGSGRFDREAGVLLESQFYAEGRATASSTQAEAGLNAGYYQTSYVQLLAEGAEAPSMGPSEELTIENSPFKLRQRKPKEGAE